MISLKSLTFACLVGYVLGHRAALLSRASALGPCEAAAVARKVTEAAADSTAHTAAAAAASAARAKAVAAFAKAFFVLLLQGAHTGNLG